MASDKLHTYVFRGTTKGYHGNKNSMEMPYTCTATHPVKALWFALECYHKNPTSAVVYVARIESLSAIGRGYNQLSNLEDEIAFAIQPAVFYRYCEGFIHVPDLQWVLKGFDIDGYRAVKIENLSRHCRETTPIGAKKIEALVE